MKIIDIAICTDNVDPKGIGRIRAVRYSDYIGEKEKSITYEAWNDRDPFVCSPFLPQNINIIPEKGQAIKLINFNTDKETVNQEYIAGPFTTMFDFNGQTFSQQVENTSYGVAVKHSNDIINTNGNYRDPRSEASFANTTDYGVYGKYGSDIIFTENGLQLRGGKLVSKNGANASDRKTMVTYPIMSDKSSRIYLKKFPKKMTLIKTHVLKSIINNDILSYIIEYSVNDLTNPTIVDFDIYKIDKTSTYGQDYNTAVFNEATPLNNLVTKLIKPSSGFTHTFSINVSGVKSAYLEIRNIIHSLHEDGLLKTINDLKRRNIINSYDSSYSQYPDENTHPLFFRPTLELFERITNDTEKTNRQTILNNISVCRVGPTSGLIFSRNSVSPPLSNIDSVEEQTKLDPNSKEQSFGAVVSDKIYLLSTDTNNTDKSINFTKLNKYEYAQEDYVESIDPNTYSLVRGEIFIELFDLILDLLKSHEHNVVGPLVQDDPNYQKLDSAIGRIKNTILNNSIRIN